MTQEHRKKRALFMDFDGTFLRKPGVDQWLEAMEKTRTTRPFIQRLREIRTQYQQRERPFSEYETVLGNFWKERWYVGLHHEDACIAAEEVAEKHGKAVYVFTRELLHICQQASMDIVVISGSPKVLLKEVMSRYGVTKVFGTVLETSPEGIYTDAPPAQAPYADKRAALQKIAADDGYDLAQCIGIGDTEADTFLSLVGYPIAFNPNEKLWNIATKGEKRFPVVTECRRFYFFGSNGEITNQPPPLPGDVFIALKDHLRELSQGA